MTPSAPSPSAPSPEVQPVADLSKAPLPNQKTLRRRRNLPFQVGRFAAFNLRILRMVVKGH